MPVASRLLGAIAVGVALLSAIATFVVLAGLTPIEPVQSVVVTLLAVNAVTSVLLARHHRHGKSGSWSRRAAAAAPERGCTCRSSACSP